MVRYSHCSVLVARRSPESGQVLAATDFSDRAQPAVLVAAAETTRRGARLTLLHSLGLAIPVVVSAAVPLGATALLPPKDAIDAARSLALDLLADSLARSGVEGHRVVTAGIPADDIVETAASLAAELVVVGSRGWTGLARLALGSVAETVVNRASCSVLVVRAADAPSARASAPAG